MLIRDLGEYRRMALDKDTDAWSLVFELCDEIERLQKEAQRQRHDNVIDKLIADLEQKHANLKKTSRYITSDQASDEYIQAMMKSVPTLIAEIRRLRVEAAHVQA